MLSNDSSVEHIPVLAERLAEQISIPPDGVMVDATIGHGGHACLFGRILGPSGTIIGLDVDGKVLEKARSKLSDLACKCVLVNRSFSEIEAVLRDLGIPAADFILADLGLCSAQLADCELGLSFQMDMPLDMRIDKRLKTTAADIVNDADEKSLADLIYEYGQDRASRRIARFIVEQRRREPITTTGQLAALVCRALSAGHRRAWTATHPATRTFQALRITVNNELDNLKQLLDQAPLLLRTGAYLAVISYHSLEDRLVKDSFRQNEKQGLYRVLTKKPIVADRQEIHDNRRARSAKLRIAQRQ
jgi:16S rRNA (cytosine1402-N4)-methyltransferase